MGGTLASRSSRMDMRKKACDEINRMFGLNISVEYNEDLELEQEKDKSDTEDVGKVGEKNE